jgi:hypothetical protein
VEKRLGFKLHARFDELFPDQPLQHLVVEDGAEAFPGGPDFWLGRLYLEPGEEWTVLLRARGEPVLMERKWERGSAVVFTDAFWLSNEALRIARQPRFLSWLIGESRVVIFDETHLGVRENPGVATLVRRTNLEGVFAGLLLLALLFVWRSASAFPPREAAVEAEAGPEVTGRDTSKGLLNLLRANLSPAQALRECWREWRHSCEPAEIRRLGGRLERAEAELEKAGTKPDPVATYGRIADILNEPVIKK